MHLVLAPRRRMAIVYGAAFAAVEAALDRAIAARTAAGIPTQAYDPEAGLPDLGVAPAALEPTALIGQLEAIHAAYTQRGGIIASLWIIGGPQTTPFALLPNPLADSDGPLPVDSLYGLATTAEPLARWPVGRTPDADPPEPGLLARLLDRVAAAHQRGPHAPLPVVALCAARWESVTLEVLAQAGLTPPPLTAPPIAPGATATAALRGARMVYANIHGVRRSSAWYGQAHNATALKPAVTAADLPDLTGALVLTQACYGARLADPQGGRALAVALLAAGVAGLVATNVLAYGAPDPPPGESDLLAAECLAAFRVAGLLLGEAFANAHAALLRKLLQNRGSLGADDVKTLLSFNLYGDPALRWCA